MEDISVLVIDKDEKIIERLRQQTKRYNAQITVSNDIKDTDREYDFYMIAKNALGEGTITGAIKRIRETCRDGQIFLRCFPNQSISIGDIADYQISGCLDSHGDDIKALTDAIGETFRQRQCISTIKTRLDNMREEIRSNGILFEA